MSGHRCVSVCFALVTLLAAGSAHALSCSPTVKLVDKGPGLVDGPMGFKVASFDVEYDTGCDGAEGSTVVYDLNGPPSTSARWSGIRSGGANLKGTDHYDVDPGRAYIVKLQASCCTKCGGIGQTSLKGNAESQLVVAPAWIFGQLIMTTTPAGVFSCFPTGKEVTFKPSFLGKTEGTERFRVHVKGGGVDTSEAYSSEDLAKSGVKVTVPNAGKVEFWMVHEPYGVESNHVTLDANASGCGEGGSDAGTSGTTDAGKSEEPAPSGGGCSAATGAVSLVTLLALLPVLSRRRRP